MVFRPLPLLLLLLTMTESWAQDGELIFLTKQGKGTLTVHKNKDFEQRITIFEGGKTKTIDLEVGQQFFLTAEFMDLDQTGPPEVVLVLEYGASGMQTIVLKKDSAGEWQHALDHVGRGRLRVFYQSDKSKTAALSDEGGKTTEWVYVPKQGEDWAIERKDSAK